VAAFVWSSPTVGAMIWPGGSDGVVHGDDAEHVVRAFEHDRREAVALRDEPAMR